MFVTGVQTCALPIGVCVCVCAGLVLPWSMRSTWWPDMHPPPLSSHPSTKLLSPTVSRSQAWQLPRMRWKKDWTDLCCCWDWKVEGKEWVKNRAIELYGIIVLIPTLFIWDGSSSGLFVWPSPPPDNDHTDLSTDRMTVCAQWRVVRREGGKEGEGDG